MSFYKKQLEAARRAVMSEEEATRASFLDGDTSGEFAAPTAAQQKEVVKEGLMRPTPRPEPKEESASAGRGLGLALMASMRPVQRPETEQVVKGAPETSVRPQRYSEAAMPKGDAPDRIKRKLEERGLPTHVAEAFVLNMADESGFDSGVNEIEPLVKGSRGGFGLYQLTGKRRKDYEAFAADRGVSFDSEDAQLDFLIKELRTTEKRAGDAILGASNTSEAAVAIVDKFLRPSEEYRQNRIKKYKRYST